MKHSSPSGPISAKARNSATRLAAVQAVYQMLEADQRAADVVAEYMQYRLGKPVEGQAMVPPDGVRFKKIVEGVEAERAHIDGFILAASKERTASDANKKSSYEPLLYAVLLCGVYELFAHPEIDAPIIISDYIDVTHAFYEHGEPKLVNGILDKVKTFVRDAA